MIKFAQHKLSNGLELIVHSDHSSPIVCLNILYKVGSRNEDPERTGFAHLFEHLMFGGSKNVKNFDEPLQRVGGDNNAFTNPDITNYYVTIPSNNVETAFWLESDRMLSLSFDPEVLEVQRKVVIEEFKQRYLNQPYGDVWLKLRPMAYNVHPYKWSTIGKELSHIENATMEDVKDFFAKYYHPSNAIMVVAGDITEEKALELTNRWFGEIPAVDTPTQLIPKEPKQTEERILEHTADVPVSAVYKAYHMPSRLEKSYHAADLLSDILGRGGSSILYQRLVKEQQLFSSISAYVSGSYDPGLFSISGKCNDGVTTKEGNEAIEKVLGKVIKEGINDSLIQKVKNQSEASSIFSEVDVLNRAMSLAYAAFLGDANLVNEELDIIKSIKAEDIELVAAEILTPENCSTLFYNKN
ncbi:MAG: pitrilysin family protein [Cyclobacteriaceae bacterium]